MEGNGDVLALFAASQRAPSALTASFFCEGDDRLILMLVVATALRQCFLELATGNEFL